MKVMTEGSVFFCDSYALIEFARGNLNYTKYLDEVLITSDLNVMELYYAFLRETNREKAEEHYLEWIDGAVKISEDVIRPAMEFKLKYKKENLSYIDCLGYLFAIKNKIRFLTGDEKFENKPGVEFVK